MREHNHFRQTSEKSPFQFSLSMYFTNQKDYDAYNAHPIHAKFVEDRWMSEVKEFQEMDFEDY